MIIADSPAHEKHGCYCSFAPCNDELACINEIIKAVTSKNTVPRQHIETLKALFGRIKGIKAVGAGVELNPKEQPIWQDLGEQLIAHLTDLDGDWLIAVDELPIFILTLLKADNGRERARHFLNWLRHLRQTHPQIRWLLAGSIGLDTVTGRQDLGDTINDLSIYHLDAFSAESSNNLLEALSESYEIPMSKAVREYVIEKIGWPIPYYLQIMFEQLYEQWLDDKEPLSLKSVDNAFEAKLSTANKNIFDYWRQRLHDELGEPDSGYCERLLNEISKSKEGMSRESLGQILATKISDSEKKDRKLIELLDILEIDGYLIRKNDRLCFRLEWLREYWRRRLA